MFDTLSVVQLEILLGHFSVPMFIAERPDPGTALRLVGMNTAVQEIIDPTGEIRGATLHQMFPAELAKEIMDTFQQCCTHQETLRFNSAICGASRNILCDLSLQYSRTADGYDRIVATILETPQPSLALQDRLAFEDVRYFSFIADLQLENLNSAFDTVAGDIAVAPIDDDRIMRLHAVCRTIQRTVSDIKQVVRQAQARHAAMGSPHYQHGRGQAGTPQVEHESDMFRSLVEANSAPQRQRVS